MWKIASLAVFGLALLLIPENISVPPAPDEAPAKPAACLVMEFALPETPLPISSCRERVHENAVEEPPSLAAEEKGEEEEELEPRTIEVTVYDDEKVTTSARVTISFLYDDANDPDTWRSEAFVKDNGRFRFECLDWGSYEVSVELRGTKQTRNAFLQDRDPWRSERRSFHFGHARVIGTLFSSDQGPSGLRRVELDIETPEGYTLQSQDAESNGRDLRFRFENLPAGRASIYWRLENEEEVRWGTKSLPIGENETKSLALGECQDIPLVEGSVQTFSGIPVPFAHITLQPLDSPLEENEMRMTNEDGLFAFRLAPGLYRIDSIKLWEKTLTMDPSSTDVFASSPNASPLAITIQGSTILAKYHLARPEQNPPNYLDARDISLDREERSTPYDCRKMKDDRFLLLGVSPGRHRILIENSHGYVYSEKTIEIESGDRLIELDFFPKQD